MLQQPLERIKALTQDHRHQINCGITAGQRQLRCLLPHFPFVYLKLDDTAPGQRHSQQDSHHENERDALLSCHICFTSASRAVPSCLHYRSAGATRGLGCLPAGRPGSIWRTGIPGKISRCRPTV